MYPILSFVIPVYNVEKYLWQCLNSIYQQNVDINDFEVIAVDDCGTDNSVAILREFQDEYPNFTIITHQYNKGLGAARNTGLQNLKGKYVWFIDSDDLIVDNILSKIISLINENNELELLMFNARTIDNKGNENKYYATYPQTTGIIDGITFLSSTLVPHWQKPVTAWSRIQNVSFLKKYNFYYPEGVYFEDEELHLKELFVCKHMKYVKDICYLYRINNQSIMRTKFTIKKFIDKVKVFTSCLKILDSYKNKYPNLIKKRLSPTYLSVLNQLKKEYKQMNSSDREIIRKQLKSMNLETISHFTHNNIKFMLYHHPDLYEKISWLI